MSISWSKNFTSENFPINYFEWSFDDKLKLFEDQVLGWQLDIADEIINNPNDNHPHAAFAILSILLNYFEMIGGYLEGIEAETNRTHFKKGLVNVFPMLSNRTDVINILYKEARCGMYHVGITGKNIVLSKNYNETIAILRRNDQVVIVVDPHSLTKDLIDHFKRYIKLLKTSQASEVKRNFEKRFDFLKREKVTIQGTMN